MKIDLIVGDWGSTSLRVYAMDAEGSIIDRRSSNGGVLVAQKSSFEQVLQDVTNGWLEADTKIIFTGMVGARGGWVEVPYCSCPAGVEELVKHVHKVDANIADVYIVPGLDLQKESKYEVMRSEETQIFGVLTQQNLTEGVFVVPGTHTKWVTVKDAKIIDFQTYITGDMFAALTNASVIGALFSEEDKWDWNADSFLEGVDVGSKLDSSGKLLNELFQVRTKNLSSQLEANHLAPFLSGMLIGAELAQVKANNITQAIMIGDDNFSDRYIQASNVIGITMNKSIADAVVHGLAKIAKHLD